MTSIENPLNIKQSSLLENNINNDDTTNTNMILSDDDIACSFEYDFNYESSKDPFLKRIFHKMNEGSLRASTFSMISTLIGTGCLAMPYYVHIMSISLFLICLVVSGVGLLYNCYFLVKSAAKVKTFNYSDLAEKVLSKKWKYLIDISIIIYVFGAIIYYQVLLYRMIGNIYYDIFIFNSDSKHDWNGRTDFVDNGFFNDPLFKWPINIVIGYLILLPFGLYRELSDFKIPSLLGTIFYVILILIILIQCPFFIVNHSNNINLNWFDFSKAFDGQLKFFSSFASIFFAFGAPIGALSVFRSLKHNSKRRIRKVFNISISFETICYIFISLAGYFSSLENTPEVFIDRTSPFSNDYIMTCGKILLIINLIISYIVNYLCCKISLVQLIYKTEHYSFKQNFILTFIVITISTSVGTLYSKVTDYLSIFGGLIAVVLAFLVPTLIHTKVTHYNKYDWRVVIPLIYSIILTIIGWIGALLVLKKVVTGNQYIF